MLQNLVRTGMSRNMHTTSALGNVTGIFKRISRMLIRFFVLSIDVLHHSGGERWSTFYVFNNYFLLVLFYINMLYTHNITKY